MPLPIRINYVDANQEKKTKTLVDAKPSGYEPGPDYHPTMVVVRCFGCGGVGVVEFVNGFDLKKGDALMQGKPIRGNCARCGRETELIPIAHAIGKDRTAHVLHEYKIAAAVDRLAKKGQRIPDNGIILPVEKQEEYERRIAGA